MAKIGKVWYDKSAVKLKIIKNEPRAQGYISVPEFFRYFYPKY